MDDANLRRWARAWKDAAAVAPASPPGAFLRRVKAAVERGEVPEAVVDDHILPAAFWPLLPAVEALLRREADEDTVEEEIRKAAVAVHHAMAGLNELVQIAARPPLRARQVKEPDGVVRWRLVRDEGRQERSLPAQVASLRSAARRGDTVWQRHVAELSPLLAGLLAIGAGGIDGWARLVRAGPVQPITTLPPAPPREAVLALLDKLAARSGGRPTAWQRDEAVAVAVSAWTRVTLIPATEGSARLRGFLADLALLFDLEAEVRAATEGSRTYRKIIAKAKVDGF